MADWTTSAVVAAAGAAGGFVLGLAARFGKFCTLAAIEDALFGGDLRRLRMWALAMAVAILGVAGLAYTGAVDFSFSLYHRLQLNPIAWIIGGVMFGLGMALCGTCGYGTLARIGGGDLRALFGFLVIGIAAYMAIAGPTALFRAEVLDALALNAEPDAPRTLVDWLGAGSDLALAVSVAIAVALTAWSLSNRGFRQSVRNVFWAVAVGAVIVSGWCATGILGADPFEPQPLASHTYSAPLGQTLIYFMTMSSATITFGIGATLGVICGAFVGALMRREFRWEGADDAREMRRHLVGAFLMGTGGVYAGGCTIGQGLSAASVLAISTPIVLASIWVGVWLGLSYLMEGTIWSALKALAGRPTI